MINSSTTPAKTSYPKKSNNLAEHSKNWYHQILAYHHARLSNSITEAMNNLIKRIKRTGYRFTNFTNYHTRCLRYAGKPN
ncbi:transposase [Arcanobacterium phocisimile]|uniref:Transposase n=1 Tax=Arcanobacterium phocisimile TaxID=1302235 RepID=A0ABX7IGI8_9ACTO|nr:transposase [Arcanobacterium phocisimile]